MEILHCVITRAAILCDCHLPAHGRCDQSGYFILDLEHVYERAVETFRPDVIPGPGFDQLCGNAYPIGGTAHTALENILDTQRLGNAGTYWIMDGSVADFGGPLAANGLRVGGRFVADVPQVLQPLITQSIQLDANLREAIDLTAHVGKLATKLPLLDRAYGSRVELLEDGSELRTRIVDAEHPLLLDGPKVGPNF